VHTGVYSFFKTENQKHASLHRPARRPLMVFDSNVGVMTLKGMCCAHWNPFQISNSILAV
jgi:hypothetical protein